MLGHDVGERRTVGDLHLLCGQSAMWLGSGSNDAGRDEFRHVVDVTTDGAQSSDGSTVLGHDDLLAGLDAIEKAAELVLEFTYTDGRSVWRCGYSHGASVDR